MTTPERIGQYEVVGRLAHGGMGTLYLARRGGVEGFSRHVAIKVLHPNLAQDERLVRMFVDEAKLSSRVNHPGVVHVEEFGHGEQGHYLVMEYVHGCALSELTRELARSGRRMEPALAVHVAMQIADGLHAAHETAGDDGELLQIVHRDVSPQNVLLGFTGHVKLIDFGIARSRQRAAETGVIDLKGKLSYMAPEQARAKPVDRRTDVYALGIVLWEALTLRRLFWTGNDFRTLDLVRDPKDVVPPSKYNQDVPAALDDAVRTALARDADGRPPTARAFKKLLAQACPEARDLDSEDLRELLFIVMRDFIHARHEELPTSVSQVLQLEATMARFFEDDAGGGSDTTPQQQRVLRSLTSEISTPEREAAMQGFPLTPDRADSKPSTAAVDPVRGPPTRLLASRRWRATTIVAAAVVGLGVAVGGGLALFGGDDEPEPVTPFITRLDPPFTEPEPVAESSALENCRQALASENFDRAVTLGELAVIVDPDDDAARDCRDDATAGQHYSRGLAHYDDEEYAAAHAELSQVPEGHWLRERTAFGRAMAEYHLMRADMLADEEPAQALEHAQAALDTEGARRSQRSQAQRLVQTLTASLTVAPDNEPPRSSTQRQTPPARPSRPEAVVEAPPWPPRRESCDVGSPDYTRCIVRTLEGRAHSARELNQLIAAHRQIGDQNAAFRNMTTFVTRFPNHARSQGYRQILAAHGIRIGM